MARRLLLYSHDTFGLGNIRRNYLLASSLVSKSESARVLLLTSSRWFHLLPDHPRIEFVKLPEVVRVERGGYAARSEGVALDPLVRARREILVGAARGFRPDLLVVDKAPLGIGGELVPTLDWMRRKGRSSVLVVRDVLDEPAWTCEHWTETGQYEALDTYYAAAWILGDRDVFATAAEYGFDRTGVDVRYAGYLGRPAYREGVTRADDGRLVVTVGGGEDGEFLIDRVAAALPRDGSVPAEIVFGPYFPATTKRRLAENLNRPNVRCVDYVVDLPRRIRSAAGVVSMGGYNTVCEILSADAPALVIPRTRPAREQLIRAGCMSSLGYFDTVEPGAVTEDDLARRFGEMIDTGERVRRRPDMEGVARVTQWALSA